ncbi:hypothetical protein NZA98_35280, partial [Escherichia coli]|nr:hypothetical protein [Escherichia coli]
NQERSEIARVSGFPFLEGAHLVLLTGCFRIFAKKFSFASGPVRSMILPDCTANTRSHFKNADKLSVCIWCMGALHNWGIARNG